MDNQYKKSFFSEAQAIPTLPRRSKSLGFSTEKYGTLMNNCPASYCVEMAKPRIQRSEISEQVLNDIHRHLMSIKLRKLMAMEVVKNRVRGDLRQIVTQLKTHTQDLHSREFVILGGGPKSLQYMKKKSKSRPSEDGDKQGFTIEVDVRGYIPDNVSVDTQNNHMSIKATKVNGVEKVLKLLAPSSSALEKVKIHPPKRGKLLIQYPVEPEKNYLV